MDIILNPKKVTKYFTLMVIALTIAHIIGLFSVFRLGYDGDLVHLFDLGLEKNIPTMYSSFAILFCSLLLGLISWAKKKRGELDYYYWLGLAAIFFFLSFDEAIEIHERFTPLVRSWLNTSGIFYFAWVIPYAIFVVFIFLLYVRFIINLPAKTRFLFIMAGVVYLGGSLGLELISATRYKFSVNERDLIYEIMNIFEEVLEMGGIVVFIYALMSYIDSELKDLRLKISSS